jgi:hypothetical protein
MQRNTHRPFIVVDPSEYHNANAGRSPRGRGLWAFAMATSNVLATEPMPTREAPYFTSGTYAEAVRAARREAERIGATTVFVLS